MNLRLILAAVSFLIINLTIAQEATLPPDSILATKKKYVKTKKIPNRAKCVNSRIYPIEEILKLRPFENAAKVSLVSYFKIKRSKTTDQIQSIISDKGEFEPIQWAEEITLKPDQVKRLGNILFNYGNQKVPYVPEQVQCYMPNNAILFYDSTGKIASVIELSFACETILSLPAKLETGTWCSEKFDVLRKFLEDNGMKYFGMDQ